MAILLPHLCYHLRQAILARHTIPRTGHRPIMPIVMNIENAVVVAGIAAGTVRTPRAEIAAVTLDMGGRTGILGLAATRTLA